MCHHFTYFGDKTENVYYIKIVYWEKKKHSIFMLEIVFSFYSHTCYFPTKVRTTLTHALSGKKKGKEI